MVSEHRPPARASDFDMIVTTGSQVRACGLWPVACGLWLWLCVVVPWSVRVVSCVMCTYGHLC